jgi:hypothetical protein
MAVGENRPLRDRRNEIVKTQFNPLIDKVSELSDSVRAGKGDTAENITALEQLYQELYSSQGNLSKLRTEAGTAEPFDPTLVKDLDKLLATTANNIEVVNYDLRQEKKELKNTQGVKPATTTPPDTAAGSIENKTGTVEETPATDAETKNINDAGKSQEAEPGAAAEDTRPAGGPSQDDAFGNSSKVKLGAGVIQAQGASNTEVVDPKKIVLTKDRRPRIIPTPNQLGQFSSYTYNISLHMLSKEDFNAMGSDPDKGWKPSKTLIGGAGRYGDQNSGYFRDKNFEDDFYFDNFKMTTIIGSTAGNQGTNAVELSWTLIEPYGITLIDRLIDCCKDPAVDGKNYLEAPYLIEINFYGYNDEGVPIHLIGQRKFIPIKLLSCGIKASIRGAEYSITAVPYAHSGFTESIAATPANFEVTAGTLTEFFLNTDENGTAAAAAAKENQRIESEKKKKEDDEKKDPNKTTNTRKTEKEKSSPTGEDDSVPTYNVRSFVAAYNAWQERLVTNNNATDYNTINVVFDKAITGANNNEGGKIIAEQAQSSKQVAEKDPTNPKDRKNLIKADAGKPTAQPNFKTGKFPVNSGTSVVQVINTMMASSQYIRSQMVDPTKDLQEQANASDKPINWWKVTTSVKLRKFCTQTSKWYMDVTYNVIPYTVYNRTHPNAPKDLPTGWHKEYFYLYTGKNTDIIDFQIEFDSAFYTAVNIDRGKVTAVAGPQPGKDQDENSEQIAKDKKPDRAAGSPIQPNRTEPKGDSPQTTATGNQRKDSKSMATASFAEQQNNGGGADQLSVNLKIFGDPQFIKQDEIYYNPNARRYAEAGTVPGDYVAGPDSSISMDAGEIHVLLSWRTPVDIDEETGGLRENSNYKVSKFSGIYRVLTVESTFSGGKFEQTLSCIRLPDQPQDYDNALGDSSSERKDDLPQLVSGDGSTSYKAVDSNAFNEQQKTLILSALMGNKYPPGETEPNKSVADVDATEEQNEEKDPQSDKLKSAAETGETQEASDYYGQNNENPGQVAPLDQKNSPAPKDPPANAPALRARLTELDDKLIPAAKAKQAEAKAKENAVLEELRAVQAENPIRLANLARARAASQADPSNASLKATLDAEQARVDRAKAAREPYDKKFRDAVAVTDSFADETIKLENEANDIEEQLGTA